MKEMKINKCGCGGSLPIEVFEQAEFKAYCVICRTCGCKGGTAPDKFSAIRYWNTAHPEISNAMQAVKWLEDRKAIYNPIYNNLRYFKFIKDRIVSFNKNNNVLCSENVSIECKSLFLYDGWQLYEEPKYKEVDLEYALCQYALTGMNKNIRLQFQNEEYYIEELVRNSVNLAKIDDEGGMNKFRDNLKGTKWRIYEEQGND